jgi:hypothetical protein
MKAQVLDLGAQHKIQKFTARHLALSVNCMILTRDYFMPQIKAHLVDHPDNSNGINIRIHVDKSLTDLMNNLDSHLDAITTKFSAIIIESVQPSIDSASTSVDWDAHIEKSTSVQANPYVEQACAPLFSLAKVLFQVLCLTQDQVEKQIIEPSIFKIVSSLQVLYKDKLQLHVSKYAKKRIRVDVRGFICSLSDPSRQAKLSESFVRRNLMLVEEMQSEETFLASPIRQILIDILQTRCGVKQSELDQYQYVEEVLDEADQDEQQYELQATPRVMQPTTEEAQEAAPPRVEEQKEAPPPKTEEQQPELESLLNPTNQPAETFAPEPTEAEITNSVELELT